MRPFSRVAEQRPLLCVIDDAQWLDQASALTLAFVPRRLLAESVGIVFAARDTGAELQHVPELAVQGLRNGDARALLSSTLPFKLDQRVRTRIVAETHGNLQGFDDEAPARYEVESLIARGVLSEDVRVLRGTPRRDAREDPYGSFAAGHGDDPMGTFAGPERPAAAEGSFAPRHDARAQRLGSFGDIDRDTVTTFPCAVEDVSVVSHHRLVALLVEAGLDREVAKADVEALHEGKLLVVARAPSGVLA